MELKRIASRKLFKRVPGLRDAKNGSKIDKNRRKIRFRLISGCILRPYFSNLGGRSRVRAFDLKVKGEARHRKVIKGSTILIDKEFKTLMNNFQHFNKVKEATCSRTTALKACFLGMSNVQVRGPSGKIGPSHWKIGIEIR